MPGSGMTVITGDDIRDPAAWAEVVTRDYRTHTYFVPVQDEHGTPALTAVVQVFLVRPQDRWHPETLRTTARFDACLAAQAAAAERVRLAARREETIRKAVEHAETRRLLRELYGGDESEDELLW